MTSANSDQTPHARLYPPWSDCGDRRSPDFGRVFATPAASGAISLAFDREGRHHAVTLFAGVPLDHEIVIYGRRFSVVRLPDEAGQ